ncbi:obscurin-like [Archocentrus centrarchus]|uniref:obscurin-like n=1 Tax=Archocentrus centrarchus TaxID=63155 RepID=UPI0011E9B2E1|nr:obscurin-like [Archocentrus centrarchus]
MYCLLCGFLESFPREIGKATLIAYSSTIPAGGTVKLTCNVTEFADLEYEWFRESSSEKKSTISDESDRVISISKGGIYTCRGRRKDRNSTLTESGPVTIQETVLNSVILTLQNNWTQIFTGELIHIKCEIRGSEDTKWKYEWTLPNTNTPPSSSEYTVSRALVSHRGDYRCRGRSDYLITGWSDALKLLLPPSNKAVVTLHPNWTEIYRGETITVRCEIHGGDTEWDYEWERNSYRKPPNQNEYRIRSASSSNSGNYRCKGRMKSSLKTTEWSDSVTLTVSDNEPRPVLTVSPSWLSPGASVTLNCEVEHPSAGWSFYWYKAVPDLSEKSYSYELLPDGSGTAQDSYIIDGQTHTAGYVCRAGRGDPEYHTDHSEPKFVWSADVHSAASLTVSPDRVQHFTSDSVSLTCEGNSAEWRVKKFTEQGSMYCFNWREINGSTCNINTSQSGTAVYWCESGSGEFSSGVNITVQDDPDAPILVSPVHPVTEGASVSLSCRLRTQKILSNVFFYHNDKLIQNDTREELKISAVSKSDEGFYKCEYSGRESPQSWMLVKAENSLFPVLMITGLISGIIFIVFLLLLLYCCRKFRGANDQTVNQDEHQQQVYSSLLHGDRCVYETIRGSENTENGDRFVYETARTSENTENGQHDDPEESAIYINVNPCSEMFIKP